MNLLEIQMPLVQLRQASQMTFPKELLSGSDVREGSYFNVNKASNGSFIFTPVTIQPNLKSFKEMQAVVSRVRAKNTGKAFTLKDEEDLMVDIKNARKSL